MTPWKNNCVIICVQGNFCNVDNKYLVLDIRVEVGYRPTIKRQHFNRVPGLFIGHTVNFEINRYYRVSHSKEGKVILLRWGYRFWFLLIFRILCVHEIGAFMSNSSVFIFLMWCALYGSISQHILFLNKFWTILTFRPFFK